MPMMGVPMAPMAPMAPVAPAFPAFPAVAAGSSFQMSMAMSGDMSMFMFLRSILERLFTPSAAAGMSDAQLRILERLVGGAGALAQEDPRLRALERLLGGAGLTDPNFITNLVNRQMTQMSAQMSDMNIQTNTRIDRLQKTIISILKRGGFAVPPEMEAPSKHENENTAAAEREVRELLAELASLEKTQPLPPSVVRSAPEAQVKQLVGEIAAMQKVAPRTTVSTPAPRTTVSTPATPATPAVRPTAANPEGQVKQLLGEISALQAAKNTPSGTPVVNRSK